MYPQKHISVELLPAVCTALRKSHLEKLASCNRSVILKVTYGHGTRTYSIGRISLLVSLSLSQGRVILISLGVCV